MPNTSPVAVFNAANRLSVPFLLYSKPWLSARPGDSGSIRSFLSSAWIAVFSSTQKMAACAGGFRYRPITSAALVSKSGSLEIRPPGQMRLHVVLPPDALHGHEGAGFSSAASFLLLQCVEPSRGLCLSVRSSTLASSLAGSRVGARPGWRANKPPRRDWTKRPAHVEMNRESQPSSRLIADQDSPW